MIDAIIWDYDGTLMDTRQKNLEVTREIVLEVLQKNYEEFPALHSLGNYEKANTRSANWRELYSRELLMNEEQTDCAGNLWTKYQLLHTSQVNLYSGLYEIIIELSNNYPQAIVSINSSAAIKNSLLQNNLHKFFSAIVGYEEVDFSKQKPDPDALLKCIMHLNVHEKPGTIVYIGDHETDAHCVFNANQALGKKKITSIAALYEKECSTGSWKYQPDHIAFAIRDIPEIIARIS